MVSKRSVQALERSQARGHLAHQKACFGIGSYYWTRGYNLTPRVIALTQREYLLGR